MIDDLHYQSINELAASIRSGELSPVTLTETYLERIDSLNDSLHAFVEVTADAALAAAKVAEKEIAGGDYRGPMHGIGFALKDNYDTEGVRTTACSKLFIDRVPERDSTVSARFKAAGAILLGKLTMSELAMVGAPGFGEEARNPWHQDHAPGWSSSGSGVAVAAGMCAASMGTDSGGSVRFPASANSIVGLLPTYGRVSRFGLVPLSGSIDFAGPLTRTVADSATVLQTLAGQDENDAASSSHNVPDFSAQLGRDVRGLRVGVTSLDADGLHPDVLARVSEAVKDLESLGATLHDVKLPLVEHAHIAGSIIYLSEGYAIYHQQLRHRGEEIAPVFRMYGNLGGLFSSADYIQAQRLRSAMKKQMAGLFEKVDLLALPITTTPPARLQDFNAFTLSNSARSGPTEVFNLVGAPALSVPCGFSADGLPIGLQLAAKKFDEATLFRAAHAYEQHKQWHTMHPPL
jgi:aspartyl-tRNA(Asn)/glutamyl-tRNA(Gln) amidotransferase subunit A